MTAEKSKAKKVKRIVRSDNVKQLEALKAVKKVNALFVSAAKTRESFTDSEVKSQASLIDACLIARKMSIDDTAQALVDYKRCDTLQDAVKRIKRHMTYDKASRMLKRRANMTA